MNVDLRDPVESVQEAMDKTLDFIPYFFEYLQYKDEDNLNTLVHYMVLVLSMNAHDDLILENLWAKMIEKCQNGYVVTQKEKDSIFLKVQTGLAFVQEELDFKPIEPNGDPEKTRRAFQARVEALVQIM